MTMNKKVILLTGASSGIGFETAKRLANEGHIIYGAARRVERMAELKEKYGVIPVVLDVTDASSCRQVVIQILEEQRRIDVLINNAGYGSYGAVEDVSLEEAKRHAHRTGRHQDRMGRYRSGPPGTIGPRRSLRSGGCQNGCRHTQAVCWNYDVGPIRCSQGHR